MRESGPISTTGRAICASGRLQLLETEVAHLPLAVLLGEPHYALPLGELYLGLRLVAVDLDLRDLAVPPGAGLAEGEDVPDDLRAALPVASPGPDLDQGGPLLGG